MSTLVAALIAAGTALTLPPAAVLELQYTKTKNAAAWMPRRISRRARPVMLAGDGAPPVEPHDEAPARAAPPAMKAIVTDTVSDWDEQLQTALDQPLFDPWSETSDMCSVDTPDGCVPGRSAPRCGAV